MTVDLEAIARRQQCDLSALRIALPLLEQGYEPPFLARYRRDELGAVPERALWEVVSALRTERQLEFRRDELRVKYRDGNLDDDALLASIDQAQTPRQLDRIARRIRNESGSNHAAGKLAVRLLNPKPDDPSDLTELADIVIGGDASSAAIEGLVGVLGQFLAADSRMVQAASAWMDKHVQLHVIDVHDPHEGNANPPGDDSDDAEAISDQSSNLAPTSASHRMGAAAKQASGEFAAELYGTPANAAADPGSSDAPSSSDAPVNGEAPSDSEAPVNGEAPSDSESSEGSDASESADLSESETGSAEAGSEEEMNDSSDDSESSTEDTAAESTDEVNASTEPSEGEQAVDAAVVGKSKKGKSKAKAEKVSKEAPRKKISPRQRRRKWLVSVLQPLKGKSLPKSRLTAFQVVMLGRALRSQVAQCAFKYNASHLVDFLAKTAAGLNKDASNELSQIVVDNEASIRAALEGAWWDDLIDRAARRLVSVASDSLRRQMHRQPIDANNILVIDAVGPRTSAVVIVGPDDRVLHSEDVPCQLTKGVRQQLVARLGELVHQYHVDLIVVSNGPARRGCMVALTELLAQSQGSNLRWTLAERAGAEVYAGGPEGNRELRSLPRRFRAAVWLAQLVRLPARALAKVDVSKLRLGSYQRELAEKTLTNSLKDVVSSGVCQISVDVNAADRGWLSAIPGVNDSVAEAIDKRRREALFDSRESLLAVESWPDLVSKKQAIAFLRVYGGSQALDATAIHVDDYALAEKLMGRLELPLPPSSPPGYEPPNYHSDEAKAAVVEIDGSSPSFSEVKIVAVDPDAPFGEIEDSSSEISADASVSAESNVSEDEPVAGDGILDSTVSSDDVPATAVSESADTDTGMQAATNEDASEENAAEASPVDSPAVDAKPTYEPYRIALPDGDKLSRCVKEWQVGEHRVRQIVQSVCDPFGVSHADATGASVAMTAVPKLSELKPGDLVSGVVVGVAGFGVFVELGPECSGLIHVSRVSEEYVEDLNEYLQIGDVITAWVVEIDTKRRRVSLSGISPVRQETLRQQRQERPDRPARGPAQSRGASGSGGQQSREGDTSGAQRSGGQRDTNRAAAPASSAARPARTNERGGDRPARDNRGGGNRPAGKSYGDGQGRGKPGGGRRDSGASRNPKTYTTVTRSDTPVAPLTDAMRTGNEPLRSFGDLMQFFKGSKDTPGKSESTESGENEVKSVVDSNTVSDVSDNVQPNKPAQSSSEATERTSEEAPNGSDQSA